MRSNKFTLTGIALTALLSSAGAQSFVMTRIELANQRVIVHYNLVDTVAGRAYSIHVYASNDNFINPLQKISGEVGLEVKAGNNKRFEWDPKAELGESFTGDVSLEIRGKLYIPFISMSGFEEYKSFKRLKPYEITWSGGTTQNVLNLDLYRGDQKVTTFPNVANVGHYQMTLPKDVKPGHDYHFRISDTKNKDEVIHTGTFSVKRKTPLLLKVIPILALGTVAASQGGGGPGSNEIPDPITP